MKLKTRPKYYYRSFGVIYIIAFLFVLYSAFNGLLFGWWFVVLIGVASLYWISKFWKEWKRK